MYTDVYQMTSWRSDQPSRSPGKISCDLGAVAYFNRRYLSFWCCRRLVFKCWGHLEEFYICLLNCSWGGIDFRPSTCELLHRRFLLTIRINHACANNCPLSQMNISNFHHFFPGALNDQVNCINSESKTIPNRTKWIKIMLGSLIWIRSLKHLVKSSTTRANSCNIVLIYARDAMHFRRNISLSIGSLLFC